MSDPDFGRGPGDPLGGPDAPGAGQPSPPDIDQALLRGGWDWSNYRGPLRAILAQHRGVADI